MTPRIRKEGLAWHKRRVLLAVIVGAAALAIIYILVKMAGGGRREGCLAPRPSPLAPRPSPLPLSFDPPENRVLRWSGRSRSGAFDVREWRNWQTRWT